jgi:phosphatidylglycerophosphatase A
LFVRKILLSGLGTGYLPIAPGTWGSAAAVLIWLAGSAALAAAGWSGWWIVGATAIAVAIASAICVAFGDYAVACWNSRDPRHVVIDEFAGQWVALLPVAFVPAGRPQVVAAVVAFLLFRAFDVAKPPPARQAESLPGGVGILADDIVAGAYAGLGAWVLLLSMRGCTF